MNTSTSPLTHSELLAIAPTRLHSYRLSRYQGSDERAYLRDFAPEDRRILANIYESLLRFYQDLGPHHDDHTSYFDSINAFVGAHVYHELLLQASEFGRATIALKNSPEAECLIHDLRGGAFQALIFRLQLFSVAPEKAESLQNVFFLVRDHLKIMRNCVADLDPERFHADARPKHHNVDLLVEKWDQRDFLGAKSLVHIVLDCQFTGTLCESCLEFASVDRVIYNLMNNAARFTLDGLIYFYILPVPDADGDDVRFVIVNRIAEEHRDILCQRFDGDMSEIFRGGFTTGGHGVGVRICADFCAHAYGIYNFGKAKHAGYFGARPVGDYFVTWFHWPRARR